jgi:hypothetical protein
VFRAIPLLCGTSGLFWRGKIGIMECSPDEYIVPYTLGINLTLHVIKLIYLN